MFHQARLRLTVLYSIIFLILFWSLSLGIYLWMNRFFGDEQGRNNNIRVHHVRSLLGSNGASTEPASDIVMDELRNVLLFLDVVLLFGIPAISWFMTGKTLAPVQEANEREKQFLTNASHDLRTPLSILSSEMELALRKKRTTIEYQQALQSSRDEVDNLIALTQNLLFIAHDNERYQKIQNESIDLTDVLAECVLMFKQPAKKKQLQLTFDPPADSIVIKGNKQLLKRLFTNLIDNAVKYTLQKGSIKVKLKKEKRSAFVSITDTGIGIPEDQLEKIFDRFYRVDSSRTEKGYGLGLSIAKQIIEFHRGLIKVESKVGKGTTFIITFPIIMYNLGNNQS